MGVFLRKYGTGTGADVYVPIVKRAVVDFAVSADWTPSAGDVKVSKDGAAAANIGTLPTAITMGNTAMWKFVFSDAELQCKVLSITVADSATKAVEDQMFDVETYGNASAMYQADLSAANLPANVTQFGGSNGTFSSGRPEVNTTHWAGTAVASTEVRANLINIAGSAVSTSTAQLGVNVVNFGGSAGTFASGIPAVNMAQISGDSTAADSLEAAFDGTGGVNFTVDNITGNLLGSVASVSAGVTIASGGVGADSFATGSGWKAIRSGVNCQSGSTSTTAVLDTSASATDDIYNGNVLRITSGTGAGQSRLITDYVGSSKTATVTPAWITTPTSGSEFAILPHATAQWNADWDAEAQSEVADALAVYDPPTNAEMEARTLAAASYATASSLSTAQTDITAILADTNELQTDWANGGRLDLLVDSIIADNPNRPTRGVALADLTFVMVDATDFNTPETGVTVTATISKDGGAFASCSNSASEISAGAYKITLTSTEMTADNILLKFTGTGCATRFIQFRTQPT